MTVLIRFTETQFKKPYITLALLLLTPAFVSPASAQDAAPAAPDTAAPAAAASTAAPTDSTKTDPPKKKGFQIPKIGIDVDTFMQTSGKTRSRFGSSVVGVGFGFGRPDRPSGAGRLSFDFSTQYKKTGDHHEFMAPIGISYRRAFSAEDLVRDHTFIPYYGVSADLVAVDLRSVEDNVHSGFHFTAGGSALVGTTVGKSGFAEAKYLAVGKVKGFDLSGIKLSVGVRF